MGYDFSELGKVIKAIKEAFELFVEVFKEAWDEVMPGIVELYERLQEIEYEEKVKFKPVLEIKPTKTYYQNKRITNYYCRNNC